MLQEICLGGCMANAIVGRLLIIGFATLESTPIGILAGIFSPRMARPPGSRPPRGSYRLHAVGAVIGPTGCGKSTLLRTFNRMFDLYPGQHAEGEILFNGRNILAREQNVNLLRTKIGMVFPKPTPFSMTITRTSRLACGGSMTVIEEMV